MNELTLDQVNTELTALSKGGQTPDSQVMVAILTQLKAHLQPKVVQLSSVGEELFALKSDGTIHTSSNGMHWRVAVTP